MTRRKVFLSPLAEKKLLLLLEWLEENWSSKVKEKFILKLKSSVEQISVYPESMYEIEFKKRSLQICNYKANLCLFSNYKNRY